jgi:GNAT superfamily N-acetyltransferase
MSLDRDAAAAAPPTVRLALAAAGDEAGITAAIELGNQARATLGHMPYAAYREAAACHTLLLAYAGEQVVGYALYGLTRPRVRLTHLCVDPAWRRRGVARLLVGWISERHADFPGILVKCREDYGLGEMWIRLGFTQISERPGRSRAGHVLIGWWRDHHHPNLFTRDDDGVLVKAGIDLNILRDLAEPGRADADESGALIADQIADRLELVRTAALDGEINRMAGPLRARCIARAQRLTSLRAEPARVAQVSAALLAAAQATDPGYPHNEQDRFDLAHVAEALATGLNVFVTRDEHLARILGRAAEQDHGLRILRPAAVVVHLDELARAEAYRPAALLDTSYRRLLIGVENESDLTVLVSQSAGERPRDLVRTVRELGLAGYDRVGIYSPQGQLVAAVATAYRDGVLTVPLLRIANTGLADTLARQLLFQLRLQAREAGATIIRITDRYPSAAARLAAVNDGFHQAGDQYYVFVVDECGPAAQVEHRVTVAARTAGVPEPAPLRSDMPAVAAAELERIWWPAKITDSGLSTYLIPIQQAFSVDLLGVPHAFLRHDALGLAREHVYYRSPRGLRLQAPARLLWYISGSGPGVAYQPGVVACSQLDSVVTGTPEELHSRYRHLGVWDLGKIMQASRDGQVQALRFTNTEPLAHIPLPRLRRIAAAHGHLARHPQGPLRVSAELFAALYQEGRPR